MHMLFCRTNRENLLQKERKDRAFEDMYELGTPASS